MKEITINVPITLTQDLIDNITVSAIEGGIGYWGCITDVDTSQMSEEDRYLYENRNQLYKEGKNYMCLSTIISRGGVITLEDNEDEETTWRLDLDAIIRGCELYVKGHDHGLTPDFTFEDIDADHADVIVQLGLMGEVVYG